MQDVYSWSLKPSAGTCCVKGQAAVLPLHFATAGAPWLLLSHDLLLVFRIKELSSKISEEHEEQSLGSSKGWGEMSLLGLQRVCVVGAYALGRGDVDPKNVFRQITEQPNTTILWSFRHTLPLQVRFWTQGQSCQRLQRSMKILDEVEAESKSSRPIYIVAIELLDSRSHSPLTASEEGSLLGTNFRTRLFENYHQFWTVWSTLNRIIPLFHSVFCHSFPTHTDNPTLFLMTYRVHTMPDVKGKAVVFKNF